MNIERLDRLDAMIAEGRIIRGAWTDGHERACLLAALSPEAGVAESATACPAEVMPTWMAHLTKWLNNASTLKEWPSFVRRYAALARRWHALDAAAWERARIVALIAIVYEARLHVAHEYSEILPAINGVLEWLGRGAPEAERKPLRAAAKAAAVAAADAARAAEKDNAEAWAAWAAWAACRAAIGAADAARSDLEARAAEVAAEAAAEVAYVSRQWGRAWAAAKSADRIATGVLDAIEREIVHATEC